MAKLLHERLSWRVLRAAMEVHGRIGPGLLESTYRACLTRQLEIDGLAVESEVPVPLHYRGLDVGTAYRADLIVERSLLVELKAVERLLPIHEAQVLTYLRLCRLPVALLINFNVTHLRAGIRRFAN